MIDPAFILAQADADELFATTTIEQAQAADVTLRLQPGLDKIAHSVDDRLRDLTPTQLMQLSVMRLESLERHWHFDARLYERWHDSLRLATTPYVADAAELARRRAVWQSTADHDANLPGVLKLRVEAVIALLDRAEQEISVPLARQIALGTRANAIEARIQVAQASITQAIALIDRRLMIWDVSPLWRADAWLVSAAGDARSIPEGLKIETDFAQAYSDANFGNQIALEVLAWGLLPLLLWIKRYTRPARASGMLDPSASRVLSRPWSTWLLLWMVGSLGLEPNAPILTTQASMIITLIPVLRLLPHDSKSLLERWPYLASVLYALSGVGLVFAVNGLGFRLFSLGLTLLGALGTAWLLWRVYRRDHPKRTGTPGKVLRAIAWFALGVFCAAVLINVTGNVSLADMLTTAVISSAYLALTLYVSATVALTFLHLLLTGTSINNLSLARRHVPHLVQLLKRLILIGAVIGWVIFTVDSFRVLRPVYAFLSLALGYEFTIGEFSITMGHILAFIATVAIAFWISHVTRLLLRDLMSGYSTPSRGIGNSVASLVSYAILLLGIVIALSAAGFKGSQLALVFGALGVGVGFGLQNVVHNFVSGLILMFERPIQAGDVVEIGSTSGRVSDIGMRATRIKTFDGADVIVPNGSLLSERLTNWTLRDRHRRLEISVGVAYGSDPQCVMTLLSNCALQTPGVASEPKLSVFFMGAGASALDFVMHAWIHDLDRSTAIRSELLTRVHVALKQAGIEVPIPQRDVHIRSMPDDRRERPRVDE
ncbi:mechanosensitive ion channel domain-containing protein [Paraburkholderia sp. BCC1876]|uniref:mechanosensitive ion channel family protein n=1 Tax=Paraburkholderia sp. BCC1876 TaxID=2676303 RepID=UPI0015928698|nr:mechanosensitive ion channel domain-containing protein [Paraburkholderia sp. BCC1876]